MRFSAGEAAFEGFRVTRHHPMALLAWAAAWLVSLIATALTAMPILGPVAGELQEMMQAMASGAAGEASSAIQARLTYAMWATLPISLVTQAIILPALYRAIDVGGRDRFAFFRLGRTELRMLMVLAILALISLLLNQLGEMAVTLAQGTSMALLGGLASFVLSIVSIFVSVRLVLAAPQTFAQDRIDLKSAWALSKGVFWSLLGMAIIAGVMACIVVLLLFIVSMPISAVMTNAQTSPAGMAAALGILSLMAIGAALVMTIVSAPFMAAYRELKDLPQE